MNRVFIQNPVDDLAAELWHHIPGFQEAFDASPRYSGGFNLRVQAAAFRQFLEKQTYRDIYTMSTTGKSQLHSLYGKKQDLPSDWLDFFGHQHGAVKVLPNRAGFYSAVERLIPWYAERGYDVTDPATQEIIFSHAYGYAARDILMNDNALTTLFKRMVNLTASQGEMGKVAATAARLAIPIAKVPPNFAIEVGEYAFGLPIGLSRVAGRGIQNLIRGLSGKEKLEDLKPEQADGIARCLSKGLTGFALLWALGYYFYEDIGGYYQPGERRKNDVHAGGMRLFGWEVPFWLPILHVPPLEVLQMGSTVHRIQNHYAERLKTGGALAGVWAATKGLASHIPFFEEPSRMAESMKDTDTMGKSATELVTSMIVPPDVQKVARVMDKDESGDEIKRKPKTPADVVKMHIPVLRDEVPRNVKVEKEILKDKLIHELRDGKEEARQHLIDAIREKKITTKDRDDIVKQSKESPLVTRASRMTLETLAEGYEKNATPEEKILLKPILKKKIMNAAGKIPADEKQRYLDLLKE
jgi:hypothetical protein